MDKKILKVKIFKKLFGTYKEVCQVADISTTIVNKFKGVYPVDLC